MGGIVGYLLAASVGASQLVGLAIVAVGWFGGVFVSVFVTHGFRHESGRLVFDKVAALNHWNESLVGLGRIWNENVHLFGFVMILVGLAMLSVALFDSSIRERGPFALIGITLLATGAYTARALLASRLGLTARRVVLMVGVLLAVVNILPAYRPVFRGGGYYYWPSESRLLLAIGVVLVLLAVLTKPKGEPF